jgi:DNA polymerase-3 subunit epsilon
MGRCLSPCLNDLDPNVYRERLDAALRLFVGREGGAELLARMDEQIAEASAARRYERAAWLQRRRARLESLLGRLGGVLRAIHTGARLVLAPHPEAAGRFDALWIAGGRVVDWGAVDGTPLAPRSARAFNRAPAPGRLGGWLPADAIPETRLVGAWIAANEPPMLELGPRTGEAEHEAFLGRQRGQRRAG